MIRTAIAAAILIVGATAASAQSYGPGRHGYDRGHGYGHGYHRHGPVVVVPPRRVVVMPPPRHRWHGWHRHSRWHGYYHRPRWAW
jgi:hypothetical protein